MGIEPTTYALRGRREIAQAALPALIAHPVALTPLTDLRERGSCPTACPTTGAPVRPPRPRASSASERSFSRMSSGRRSRTEAPCAAATRAGAATRAHRILRGLPPRPRGGVPRGRPPGAACSTSPTFGCGRAGRCLGGVQTVLGLLNAPVWTRVTGAVLVAAVACLSGSGGCGLVRQARPSRTSSRRLSAR